MDRFRAKRDLTALTSFPTFPFRPPVYPRDVLPEAEELVRPGDPSSGACAFCEAPDEEFLWCDHDWRLKLHRPSALPGTVVLHTRRHWESLVDMPAPLVGAFGPVCVRVERAILGLGGVARVHAYRSGDGHAHFHMWFYARPHGFQQFRGTFLSTWAEILEPRPADEVEEAGRAIASAMSLGT